MKDAHYGEILFYFYQQQYFPAIVRLLAAQRQSQLEHHADEADLLLGGLYLSYGHHQRAAAIFERLLAGNAAPSVRDRTWLFLAKIWFQRGYPEESLHALGNIRVEMSDGLEAERRMLTAQLLIDGGRYEEAASHLADWAGSSAWANYAKYNLGVAMVRSGRVTDAARMLDAVGMLRANNEEAGSLRDKANLALGYAYLQDGQPLAAKPLLQRVRLEGPFSNKALLGVGWADAETDNYRRALVPWMELRGRDLLDSAVQESHLAVPYAMARLDATGQAADYYLRAIEAFGVEIGQLEQAVLAIEQGSLIEDFLAQQPRQAAGWHWQPDSLPPRIETRYLYHLLATHRFQEGLKNYRDLNYLAANLDEWRDNMEVFRNILETRELAYRERLPGITETFDAIEIEHMIDQKLEYDARLNGIEQARDSLALATGNEFRVWGEIAALEHRAARAGDSPQAREARHKIALLKGVLQWNLDKEFGDRLWRIRRHLRQTGEALVDTQRVMRGVEKAFQAEPSRFVEFNRRVEALSPQIEAMRAEVDVAMARHRRFLQSIAVAELEAQRERLQAYGMQARFALAAIYDQSATVGDATR